MEMLAPQIAIDLIKSLETQDITKGKLEKNMESPLETEIKEAAKNTEIKDAPDHTDETQIEESAQTAAEETGKLKLQIESKEASQICLETQNENTPDYHDIMLNLNKPGPQSKPRAQIKRLSKKPKSGEENNKKQKRSDLKEDLTGTQEKGKLNPQSQITEKMKGKNKVQTPHKEKIQIQPREEVQIQEKNVVIENEKIEKMMTPRKSKAPVEPSKSRIQFRLLGKIRNSPKRIKREKVVHFHQLGLLAETKKGLPSLQDLVRKRKQHYQIQEPSTEEKVEHWLSNIVPITTKDQEEECSNITEKIDPLNEKQLDPFERELEIPVNNGHFASRKHSNVLQRHLSEVNDIVNSFNKAPEENMSGIQQSLPEVNDDVLPMIEMTEVSIFI